MVYLDFGFIEPALISELQGALQSSVPLPERINGRMAARVAVGLDVLQGLHKQLGSVIEGMTSIAQQQLAAYNELQETQKKQKPH